MTTPEFMQHQVRRWQLLEKYNCENNATIWEKFKIIIQALYDMEFILDDEKFYFCHLDLYARNMLVEIEDDSTLRLTGLLDWDAEFAHFCPKFVAYRAPFWLWLSRDQNEYDEMIAADTPVDADLQHLKILWEDVASDEWKRYAYTPEYLIARRIFTRLRNGICCVGDKNDARSIIDDWQKLHYDQKLTTVHSDDDDSYGSGYGDRDHKR
ncbi:uncharacterized protein ALTATR162_LOCUS7095 [Alternaria atra]|uniref:Aminoglycoside phosphotransferase domain-containing protein n=1 Tax=Alternaria atra TaxID=119953 RepID=A0A8J2I4G6_9PLEO|nr:uncharacterized protein ALTATR162_LOCUS7095 [Alternaria atra]CAG5169891.1 unnamed protein product [Alternaria atra]